MEFLVRQLMSQTAAPEADVETALADIGFADSALARQRLQGLASNREEREPLTECLPVLLMSLAESANPDGSLLNFERYVQAVSDRCVLFRFLAANPRAVEILVKLFVGSQFLTEILLRRPQVLEELTNHKQLADFKSRPQLIAEALTATEHEPTVAGKLDALRRFQQWELLRIGACDSFRLFDLKSVTVQLSLLADSIVQSCFEILCGDLGVDPAGFVVLAFGKLGGEELNYSSDIDLVFLSADESGPYWKLGQRLVQSLLESTGEGFLYRVDMRLRPWGRSGALVNSIASHVEYLQNHGDAWEKQALLKARPVAGDLPVGDEFLRQVEPLIFSTPVERIRDSIIDMKSRIETQLETPGRMWGDVKLGDGSIRDVEFVTQCLQLTHGRDQPAVRSFNTMSGLVRLADFGFLQADDYRSLSTGYVFLRTIEHALQLMHNKQTHSLPTQRSELTYLARRLDFSNADEFVHHHDRHRKAIRRVFRKYVAKKPAAENAKNASLEGNADGDHRGLMAPTYAETFSDEEIANHAALLKTLSDNNPIAIDAIELSEGRWRLTIVGFNHIGELSVMCGLLFVHGWNILEGDVFTAEHVKGETSQLPVRDSGSSQRTFVNVFTVITAKPVMSTDVWQDYDDELTELVSRIQSGRGSDVWGRLAKRVAAAFGDPSEEAAGLRPITVEIDNEASALATILRIQGEDSIGFLYEMTNALAMARIEIERVAARSIGTRVADTLFVTDTSGEKITCPDRLRELRAAVVLTKHFTHLLPRAPNPEKALIQFREFLEQLFRKEDWVDELATLEQPDVLHALAKLLGGSEFLWEDFLRVQHDNLFPVVKDIQGLANAVTKAELSSRLREELTHATNGDDARKRLNDFKDREMFRVDMRHLLGHVPEFGQFAEELSDLADVIVEAAFRLCTDKLRDRYGTPQLEDERECGVAVFALGKCGGRELGYGSDIELMFLYEGPGKSSGPKAISTGEFCRKLVAAFTKTIRTREEGIFQVDLRLRPYGQAGSLAVSEEAFRRYFAAEGPAWPYERQALVKLRQIAGDENFGLRVMQARDQMIFTGEPFDAIAMRAMREKQITQMVKGGTFNAKLSAGGLVDCEYLVQGLQITHGRDHKPLRTGSTVLAITSLQEAGILCADQASQLQEAYVFLRRMIDALRMVRGHALDLTVPKPADEAFHFLSRRLGYGHEVTRLQDDLNRHRKNVEELSALLDRDPSTRLGI